MERVRNFRKIEIPSNINKTKTNTCSPCQIRKKGKSQELKKSKVPI